MQACRKHTMLWSTINKPALRIAPPTRLTQRHKREAKGAPSFPPAERIPRLQTLCRGCGKTIRNGRTHCGRCAIGGATQRLADAARTGRISAHTPEALAREAKTQRQHAKARSAWSASSQPTWLTPEFYSEKIQSQLAEMSNSAIASAIGVSRWYAGRIRKGYRPHPRHWQALAGLAGVTDATRAGDSNSA